MGIPQEPATAEDDARPVWDRAKETDERRDWLLALRRPPVRFCPRRPPLVVRVVR